MAIKKPSVKKYNQLLNNIGISIETARLNAFKAIDTQLVKANWETCLPGRQVGRHIVEFEQDGKERAEYGTDLLTRLSKD